jgi:hypothetical protein
MCLYVCILNCDIRSDLKPLAGLLGPNAEASRALSSIQPRITSFDVVSVICGGAGTVHFLCISTALVFRMFALNVFHMLYISHVGLRLIQIIIKL